jgi:hypothetical protein
MHERGKTGEPPAQPKLLDNWDAAMYPTPFVLGGHIRIRRVPRLTGKLYPLGTEKWWSLTTRRRHENGNRPLLNQVNPNFSTTLRRRHVLHVFRPRRTHQNKTRASFDWKIRPNWYRIAGVGDHEQATRRWKSTAPEPGQPEFLDNAETPPCTPRLSSSGDTSEYDACLV